MIKQIYNLIKMILNFNYKYFILDNYFFVFFVILYSKII